jgi:hypothetical protein
MVALIERGELPGAEYPAPTSYRAPADTLQLPLPPCVLSEEASADGEGLAVVRRQGGPSLFGQPLREGDHFAGRRCWPARRRLP